MSPDNQGRGRSIRRGEGAQRAGWRETPHLKKSWDSKVRSAGRHCGTGFRRAACKVCWKLARAAAETETQTQLVSSAFPSQAATVQTDL